MYTYATPSFAPSCARLFTLLLLGAVLFSAAGCATKAGVHPIRPEKRLAQISRTALNSAEPSDETQRFLRHHKLFELWKKNPKQAVIQLDKMLFSVPDPEWNRNALFALAEMSLLRGRGFGLSAKEKAKSYRSCVVYSYAFLFDPRLGGELDPFHPHTSWACELYNESLMKAALDLRDREFVLTSTLRLPLIRGMLTARAGASDFSWNLPKMHHYHAAWEFRVTGLNEHVTASGMGVPLVVLRRPPSGTASDKPAEGTLPKEEQFMSKVRQVLGTTLFLRLNSYPRGGCADPEIEADFEVYDPLITSEVEVNGRSVPLDADLTTPLAYAAEKLPLPSGVEGMLNAAAWKDRQGLYMLSPYRPNNIPVVFVHGLMSSPLTWLGLLNSLLGDPDLRERCQFWFYMYPTGNPILYSAADLRDSLEKVRRTFDPEGTDPSFNRMVLVGHSMGGLLSKLMIQEGSYPLWEEHLGTTRDQLDISPEALRDLDRIVEYRPLPFVDRVVFMGTPHQGSDWADHFIGEWVAALITLPVTVLKLSGELVQAVGGKDDPLLYSTDTELDFLPTGVDSLSPDSPTIRVTSNTPISPDVTVHSIIGDTKKAGRTGGTDGVVPYSSAHLDKADTELVVLSGHGVQESPETFLELRRILHKHLGLADPVMPKPEDSPENIDPGP